MQCIKKDRHCVTRLSYFVESLKNSELTCTCASAHANVFKGFELFEDLKSLADADTAALEPRMQMTFI